MLISVGMMEGNSLSISKNSIEISNGRSQSFAPNIRKNSRAKNLADSFSNTLQKKCKEIKEEKSILPRLKQIKESIGKAVIPNVITTSKQIKGKAKSLLKPKQSVPLEPYPAFRDVFQSDLGQYFIEKNDDVVALNIAGHLFNHIGNCILDTIKNENNKRVFYPLTKAVHITVLSNNEYMVKCHQYAPIIEP